MNYFVLASNGASNDNANFITIIFAIKDTRLCIPVITLSAQDNHKLLKLHSKGFERLVHSNEFKTKVRKKNPTNEFRYFLKSNFGGVNKLFMLIYLNTDNDVKGVKRRYLPKGIFKKYYVIINGKNFYDDEDDELFLWYGWPALSPISSRDCCHRFPPSQISDMQQACLLRTWVHA